MYYRKLIYLLGLFLITIVINGCATTYAPSGWLPKTEDIEKTAYGGWLTVVVPAKTFNEEPKWIQYGGEFIAQNEDKVFLLYDSLYIIPKYNIIKSILEVDEKNDTEYGLWTLGGSVSTVTHGFFAVISLPVWLLAGIPAAVGESSRDRYEAEQPDSNYWSDINKFARFPQGLPSNINPGSLTVKKNNY